MMSLKDFYQVSFVDSPAASEVLNPGRWHQHQKTNEGGTTK
jgi:hypothetical protein